MKRDAATIEREINQARSALADTLDELTERANPKKLARQGKKSVASTAKSPVGMAILGVVGVLAALMIVRKARRSDDDDL